MFFYQKNEFSYTNDFLSLPSAQSPIFNTINSLTLGTNTVTGNSYAMSQVIAFNVVFQIDTTHTDANYQFQMNSFVFSTSATNSGFVVMPNISVNYASDFFSPILGSSGVYYLRVGCTGNMEYILPSFNYTFQKLNPTSNPNTLIIFPFIELVTNVDNH